MQNLDILILVLFAIAALRKILFWAFVIQLKEYRFDRFYDYMLTFEGRKAVFNIFDISETVLFLVFAYLVFANVSFDLLVEFLFVLLAIEVLYFLYKIVQRKVISPKWTARIILVVLISLLLNTILLYYFFYSRFYFIIMLLLLSNQMVLLYIASSLINPFVVRKKHGIITKATQKLQSKTMTKVGITGSFGKSSMKECLFSIFALKYKIIASPKNVNSEIGVSNFILNSINKDYEYFFCEMGAYKKNEIKILGDIVNHKYGFLTGIGNQHLALFGNISNIVEAKFEILDKVVANDGKLYVNYDNENIRQYFSHNNKASEAIKSGRILKYGIDNYETDARSNISQLKSTGTSFEFEYKRKRYKFETNLIGKHNVLNLTGAIAFAFDSAIDIELISDSLLKLNTPEHTLKIVELSEKTVLIDDTYNLSVDAIKSGVETLQFFDKTKILVLDDVLELGYESIMIHRHIGKQLAKVGIDKIILIGKTYSRFVEKGLLEGFYDYKNIIKANFSEKLKEFAEEGSVILFEGRGARRFLEGIHKVQ